MTHDIAVFLDLDNLVIGAKQVNLTFNINLILDHITKGTNGRIVLRRSYGDWRQSHDQLKELAIAGFTTQSTVPLNQFSKNLADMQIVVDAMDTLVDGHQYNTYVLVTGDRDFTPLVQSLRKRGKQVIGVGFRHSTSSSFASLCDEYIYYEDMIPAPVLTDNAIETLISKGMDTLEKEYDRIRASLLKQRMNELSQGAFINSSYADGSFTRFLARYPHLVTVEQEESTTYVSRPLKVEPPAQTLHARYRSQLKKRKLRVVPPRARFLVLKDIVAYLSQHPDTQWRTLIDIVVGQHTTNSEDDISKNVVNAVLLLARQAEVVYSLKGIALATSRVSLSIKGEKAFQEAVIRCDKVYLQEILALPEPFVLEEVAIALYDSPKHAVYLQTLLRQLEAPEGN